MKRIVVTLTDETEAQALDRLVARFAEDLAERSEDCVFYLTQPGVGLTARIVETEQAETLQQFLAFVTPHMALNYA
ncbi:MAG: hypothetical protein ABL308_06895 [Oceanicaulis sp.]